MKFWQDLQSLGIFDAEMEWGAQIFGPSLGLTLRVVPVARAAGNEIMLGCEDDPALFGGAMRCSRSALPMVDSSLHRIVLQHALDRQGPYHDVLRESARVLAPGGDLWLFGLNCSSPWYWKKKLFRAGAAPTGHFALRLRMLLASLELADIQLVMMGPRFSRSETPFKASEANGLPGRAFFLLRARKRVAATVAPPAAKAVRLGFLPLKPSTNGIFDIAA